MLNVWTKRSIAELAEAIVREQERTTARRALASGGLRLVGNSNLGYRRIGDTLTFYVASSLQTGAKSDADSAPTYLVYEEENATQIVTSTSMALLDSAESGVDGLYSEQITLAESTGYEFQKDYLIYIMATISSIASHALYSFRIGPEGAVDSANAQAGAAGSVTLKSGASATDDLYNGMIVVIIGGTGAGQARTVTDYVGSTKVATIEPNWITNPSSSSIYALYHHGRVAVHTGGIVAASFGAGAIDAAAIATGAVDADAIADNAIDAGAIATGAITAAKFAAGAIDAAAIAADAIGSSELATTAVDEIVDAVWDELRSGHTTAGTFGQGVASVQGNVTGSVGSVTGSVGSIASGGITSASFAAGAINAAAIATGAIDADALATDAVSEIADGVWDEDIVAAHGTADTSGLILSQLTKRSVTFNSEVADGSILGQIADDGTATFDRTTDSLQAIRDNLGGAAPSAATIADAVWDELRSGHVGAGSFGEGVASVQGNVTGSVGSIAAGGITSASFAANAITAAAIAADVSTEIRALASGTADSGTTTSMVDAARTEADSDYWKDALIVFTSGNLAGQSRLIVSFDEGSDTIYFEPATTQAVSTHTYEIWPQARVADIQNDVLGDIQGQVLDPTSIVIGVWDENLTAYVTPQTAANILKNVDTNVIGALAAIATVQVDTNDIQTRLPASLSSGRMRSQVEGIDADVITASSLDATAAAEIADAVWDEDIVAAHGTADTSGLILSQLTKRAVTLSTAVLDGSVIGQILDDGTAVYDRTTDSLQALADGGGSGPTAADIADAVWDEARAGHVTAGTFGEGVASVQGNVTGSVASVTGNVGGNVTGSVGSVASGGITSASFAAAAIDAAAIAADAIGSSELAASAVNEIADQVWDEILSGHAVSGSTGEALSLAAAGGATPAAIADAVWDELRAGHVIAGSFGEGVASVQGNVTGSVGSIASGGITSASFAANAIDAAALATSAVTEIQTGLATAVAVAAIQADTDDIQARLPATLVGGRMRSHVEAFDADVISASALAASAVAEIADGVWDEDIVAAHGTADTSGLILSQLTRRAVTLSTAVLDGSVIGQILDDGTAVYDRTTDSLQAIRDALSVSGPSAAVIADAVWDELRAGHVIAGSFGEGVASVQGSVTGNVSGSVGSVVGNVGGSVLGSVASIAAGGITSASFAASAITAAALATSAVDEIVDQTWDEVIGGHLTAGSTGAALSAASTGGASDWTAGERDQIRQALGVTGAVAPTTGTGTLELAAAGIQADTNDIQGRLPATLNNGRMRSHVEDCDPPCTGGGGGGVAELEMIPG